MNAKTIIRYAGLAAMALGAIDLMFGNSDKDPLPESITNMLTQQTDLVLIGAGAAACLLIH